jgi:hypothetical protein
MQEQNTPTFAIHILQVVLACLQGKWLSFLNFIIEIHYTSFK